MAELTTLQRARLRWRARRGMLENDLILTRFLDRYEHELTDADVSALNTLFEMDDTDLLQVLLGTQALKEPYNSPDIQRLVALIRAL
ncbi:MAG TPA: succinate dehydrogenase assembly factor 2 [Paenalcaligenes sp.]|nr:succinate dehydrogenase assembly factor 2 [Paenalcaligenes sp.]